MIFRVHVFLTQPQNTEIDKEVAFGSKIIISFKPTKPFRR